MNLSTEDVQAIALTLQLASVTTLLPYLLVAGYGVLLARSGKGYEGVEDQRGRDQVFSWIAPSSVRLGMLIAVLSCCEP